MDRSLVGILCDAAKACVDYNDKESVAWLDCFQMKDRQQRSIIPWRQKLNRKSSVRFGPTPILMTIAYPCSYLWFYERDGINLSSRSQITLASCSVSGQKHISKRSFFVPCMLLGSWGEIGVTLFVWVCVWERARLYLCAFFRTDLYCWATLEFFSRVVGSRVLYREHLPLFWVFKKNLCDKGGSLVGGGGEESQ